MNSEEWESLCDGCARCCLLKLQDADTDEVYYTNLHCKYLKVDECACSDYQNRSTLVPDCLSLTPDNLSQLHWMPATCAYRLLFEGNPLPEWHPLVSGNPESVHEAGISIRSYTQCESTVVQEDWELHVIDDLA